MTAQGKVIAQPQDAQVMQCNLRDVIILRNEPTEGALRVNGEVLLPMEYESIMPRKKFNVLMIKQNGKYGLTDNQGNTILPMEYDSISISNERGLSEIAVSKDGEVYFVNEKGERVSID